MPDSAKGFQTIVHSLEQGKFAPLIKGAAGFFILVAVALLYLFIQFRGFATETAMDQAQISRSLASGEGFSTKFIRPMAIWQLSRSEMDIPSEQFPDFTHPPLFPAWNVIPLSLARAHWDMATTDLIYAGDRIIAAFSILLLLVAAGLAYFLARRLFDGKLAMTSVILILVTDLLWRFSLSGLSQPLLMVLLLLTSLLILKAIALPIDKMVPVSAWLIHGAVGVMFGLMTLTNWLAVWIFGGYLLFAFINFRARLLPFATILLFLAVVSPWLVRNAMVCGSPLGLAIYPFVNNDLLRSMDPDFSDLFFGFREKFRTSVIGQMGSLFAYLGLNAAAGAFFLSLFHPFKRDETARFRWCILAMWVGAIAGMASYAPIDGVISDKQLHTVFVPLFIFYGLAFLMVLWNRLGFQLTIMKTVFTVAIVLVCFVPMAASLFAGMGARINWPPYVPPYIAVLGDLYEEDEGLCSDMPWAVAWYAQRRTLLIPDTPKTMIDISDYNVLGYPIRGLYLTPITGDAAFLRDIAFGRYRAWAGLIMRNQPPPAFPLRAVLPLPIDNQTVLYADFDRWSNLRKEP